MSALAMEHNNQWRNYGGGGGAPIQNFENRSPFEHAMCMYRHSPLEKVVHPLVAPSDPRYAADNNAWLTSTSAVLKPEVGMWWWEWGGVG